MSRINVSEDCDEFPNAAELWHANIQRSLAGRKGQAILRELRDALLALPQKRLIDEYVANEQGEVCTVGALLLERRVRAGEDREAALADLAKVEDYTDSYAADKGVPKILAWWFAYVNDYELRHLTPEDRYAHVLRDVESRIAS
jgi:hypothetical protein